MNLSDRIAATAIPPPQVSVISIFFDAEEYLEEAIESVRSQDFGDFELLLVDDGSTDFSPSIARDHASRDPRIRCLQHPDHSNLGMSAARNLGLRHARGQYVAFIDADDRWRPTKLKEQVALLDGMGFVDAVGGTVNYWASHAGGKDRLVPTAHVRNRAIAPGEGTLKIYPLGKAHAPSMSDLLFRRAAIEKVGGFEEAFTGAFEDQTFLAKFYLESTLFVTDAVWSDYRLHDSSCMAKIQRQGKYESARLVFLKWFERHLANSRFENDKVMQRALRRARRACEKRGLRAVLGETPLGTLARAGKARLRRLRPLFRSGPAILMYHRVADEHFDPWELAVSPANFLAQMSWIYRNRTVLPLSDFADLHREGRLPKDAIAITFDDGYACNAQTAVPVLEHFRLPATIFLPAELVERGHEFWWDELERVILGSKPRLLRLDGQEIDLGVREPDDESWPSGIPCTPRQRAYRQLWSMLYEKPPRVIALGLEQLREQAGITYIPRNSHRPMTVEEVRAISSEIVEFGSHALSHPSLPLLSSREKEREIAESVEACAELTGVRPRSFAYPYGDFDEESEQLTEKAGFICACKADGGFVTPESDPFALPRMLVGNWDSAKLARQLGRP